MRSGGIFEVQPEWCRKPLPRKDIKWSGNRIDYNKVAFFDPTELYERIESHIDPFKRNASIGMQIVWPNENKICACGCGTKLTGRQTRWASGHDGVAVSIYNIIYGQTSVIYYYLKNYYGDKCSCCGRSNNEVYNQDIKTLPRW